MYLFRDFPLSQRKEIRSALLGIYGVNWRKSINIVSKTGIAYPYFLTNINNYQFSLVFILLKGYVISDVRIKRRINTNINLMINMVLIQGWDINCRFP